MKADMSFKHRDTGCAGKIVFIFFILPPLPCQHWAAIGPSETRQLLCNCTIKSICRIEKKTFFLNTRL